VQCKFCLSRDLGKRLTFCSAFGHPLGCTGARQVVTALSELRRQNKRIAVTSMCVGTGMGMAGVFVSEH
jgi:acetyl-CoA acyltransferase 1